MSMHEEEKGTERVRNVQSRILADDYKTLRKTQLDYRRNDGAWQTITRESYDTGDGAAVLPFDAARGMVLLIRQFRWPVWQRGHHSFLIEAVAGQLDGDTPEVCARKEALEEAGVAVTRLKLLLSPFTLPGLCTERLYLFLAAYDAAAPRARSGGLAHEGEDIEVLEMPLDEALAKVASGEILDAKAIMLLQAAKLRGYSPPG
jgi:nudix-type nucleoside diphosphatase (YffH/AdpP family)